MEDLDPNEGIIYSELLFHSLTSNTEFLTGELLYIDAAKQLVENYKYMQWKEEIDYYPLDVKTLMSRTDMTFPTVKKILRNLEDKEYIRKGCIRCPYDLLQEGYIKLPKGTGAKGRQLVFYGLLLDRSKQFNGTVDTWAYKLMELSGTTKDNVYFLIKQLKAKGLVERLKDGRLKINKPKIQNGRNHHGLSHSDKK